MLVYVAGASGARWLSAHRCCPPRTCTGRWPIWVEAPAILIAGWRKGDSGKRAEHARAKGAWLRRLKASATQAAQRVAHAVTPGASQARGGAPGRTLEGGCIMRR